MEIQSESPRPGVMYHDGGLLSNSPRSLADLGSTFTFPGPSNASNVNRREVAEELNSSKPPMSMNRFHEALANLPSSRHRITDSISSAGSNESLNALPDSAGLYKSFDVIHKELQDSERAIGKPIGDRSAKPSSRAASPKFRKPMGGLQDKIEGGQGSENAENVLERNGLNKTIRNGESRYGMQAIPGPSNVGRPASIDLHETADGEVDQSFDFLLSPPTALEQDSAAARQLSATVAESLKGRERSRQRPFPKPLLLNSDRSLGTSAQIGQRKTSANAKTSPGESVASSPTTARYPWTTTPRVESRQTSNDSATYSAPTYQRHRPQGSSISSLSQTNQSSVIYTHSPHHSSGSSIAATPITATSIPLPSLSASTGSVMSMSKSADANDPILPQALLLHLLSLRSTAQPASLSQSQDPSSRSNTPQPSFNNHQRIRSAGSATSNGEEGASKTETAGGRLDTVNLSHKRIAEISPEIVDELRDEVEKLALGYNLLKDLPDYFGGLGNRLRYLNVRVNAFTSFPHVLCSMPSLEILDISRNKIKRLPTEPGTLLNLKVFSFAKNKVKRLPLYLTRMNYLKVLKIDHNPIEWPPKDISQYQTTSQLGDSHTGDGDYKKSAQAKAEDAEEMQRWLRNLVLWMQVNAQTDLGDRKPRPSHSDQNNDGDKSHSVGSHTTLSRSNRINGLSRSDGSKSIANNNSSSVDNSSRSRPTSPVSSRDGPQAESSTEPLGGAQLHRQHSRNASHSTMQNPQPEPRPKLKSKKSLPDLRLSHAEILAERRSGSGAEESSSRTARVNSHLARDGQALGAQAEALGGMRLDSRSASPALLRPRSPLLASHAKVAGSTSSKFNDLDRSASSTAVDRNSGAYFRRLSMLPVSTISKAIPATLLTFAETIRGILFALSQLYSALRQFVVFASQDRLPAPIARFMGVADNSMSLLINALDRFDSLSRRGSPQDDIIRDIFVTCRSNVITFKDLIMALIPHLTTLVSTADVRYTRTLLLMLYGSMGEIVNSWNTVRPILAELSDTPKGVSLATLTEPDLPSPTLSSASSRVTTGVPGALYRARSRTRRHAGSFSVEDVQMGAVLPPASVPPLPHPTTSETSVYTGVPQHLASIAPLDSPGGTLKARSFPKPRVQAVSNLTMPNGAQPGYRDMMLKAFDQPMTPGGAELMLHANQAESLSTSAMSYGTNLNSSQVLRTDSRQSNSSNLDSEFLDMVESTTRIAFDVYRMLLDSFDEEADGDDGGTGMMMRDLGPRRTKELTDLCILGNETTTKLRGALGRIQGPAVTTAALEFSSADAKRLADEAYAFVQTVIRFAKLVKAISLDEHGFSPRIREGVGTLTISTRELAKLLSQTSFRPSVNTPIASTPATPM